MTEPSMTNLAGLLALVLYIVVKDALIPLMRRRNHKNGNPGISLGQLSEKFSAFPGAVRAPHDEQLRVNERLEGNIGRIFERLDERVSRK